jgi:hypothetical protein
MTVCSPILSMPELRLIVLLTLSGKNINYLINVFTRKEA